MYWRRRVLIVCAPILGIVLLWWMVSGAATSDARNGAAAVATATDPDATAARTTAASTGGASTGAASASAALTSAEPTAPPPPPPPAEPQPCGDDAITLTVAPEQPEYAVGSAPRLILTVGNRSAVACTRDFDSAKQEILLFSGETRFWSSNDCYPETSNDVRTLQPGESIEFVVTWSGRSSEPTCAEPRNPIPAGTYVLRARLDTKVSADTPIAFV